VWKRVNVAMMVAFAFGAYPLIASAAGYNLSATGTRQSDTAATTCGVEFGDAYDATCPSDPINKTTCGCTSYNANITGNKAGLVKDLSGKLHLTTDSGPAVDTPDCQPIFGELSFAGTKDTETIYLNGSHCNAKLNGDQELVGGWGTFSSSSAFKALGTFSMTKKPDESYSMTLSGKTK
jgi:hypothetical protein